MTFIFDILGVVFGPIMRWIFLLVGNYGVAIIVFTLLCRLVQLPFAVKQQRNMAKNTRMTMKLRKITDRYKDDKRRQQEETQKFYQREGYNPLKAGCSGGMLAQFPIMFGLVAAINRPLQYTMQLPQALLAALERIEPFVLEAVGEGGFNFLGMGAGGGPLQVQLRIVENIEKFADWFGEGYRYVCQYCEYAYYGSCAYVEAIALIPAHYADYLPRIQEFATNDFQLFGLSLGQMPGDAGALIGVLIPVLAGAGAMATSLFTFFRQRDTNPQMQQQGKLMTGCMTFIMPLFSAVWAIWFPIGVGIFWIISSFIAFVQTVALHYAMPPQKMLARVLVEETVERRSRENSKKKIAEL
ncbi:MAG: YidC/Oxa1 family membrane protein insertase [Oscillospiraceae bacterium]|nr:YidC/Oxa1 family membrane protein insertase [Oscillospiraceae bacterium]